jgi:tetratricopeptide (TPR) repeat protein
MFGYWLLHSSLDWFWEFPALAGPALAALGIATAISRSTADEPADQPAPGRPLLAGRLALGVAAACALLIAASVVPPWLSERELRRGTRIAAVNPDAALKDFNRAAGLNPLSPLPDKAAGVVEIRTGNYAAAARDLQAAYARDKGDSGLHLLMGVVASSAGRRREAIKLVSEAFRLAPQDEVTGRVLGALQRGRRLDPQRVDRLIRANVERRIGPQ